MSDPVKSNSNLENDDKTPSFRLLGNKQTGRLRKTDNCSWSMKLFGDSSSDCSDAEVDSSSGNLRMSRGRKNKARAYPNGAEADTEDMMTPNPTPRRKKGHLYARSKDELLSKGRSWKFADPPGAASDSSLEHSANFRPTWEPPEKANISEKLSRRRGAETEKEHIRGQKGVIRPRRTRASINAHIQPRDDVLNGLDQLLNDLCPNATRQPKPDLGRRKKQKSPNDLDEALKGIDDLLDDFDQANKSIKTCGQPESEDDSFHGDKLPRRKRISHLDGVQRSSGRNHAKSSLYMRQQKKTDLQKKEDYSPSPMANVFLVDVGDMLSGHDNRPISVEPHLVDVKRCNASMNLNVYQNRSDDCLLAVSGSARALTDRSDSGVGKRRRRPCSSLAEFHDEVTDDMERLIRELGYDRMMQEKKYDRKHQQKDAHDSDVDADDFLFKNKKNEVKYRDEFTDELDQLLDEADMIW